MSKEFKDFKNKFFIDQKVIIGTNFTNKEYFELVNRETYVDTYNYKKIVKNLLTYNSFYFIWVMIYYIIKFPYTNKYKIILLQEDNFILSLLNFNPSLFQVDDPNNEKPEISKFYDLVYENNQNLLDKQLLNISDIMLTVFRKRFGFTYNYYQVISLYYFFLSSYSNKMIKILKKRYNFKPIKLSFFLKNELCFYGFQNRIQLPTPGFIQEIKRSYIKLLKYNLIEKDIILKRTKEFVFINNFSIKSDTPNNELYYEYYKLSDRDFEYYIYLYFNKI